MKSFSPAFLKSLLTVFVAVFATKAAVSDDYTFFVRQIQMPDELELDLSIAQKGSQQSPLPVNPNGARFELYALLPTNLNAPPLDTTYVNSYIPVSTVKIVSEDPYDVIPRTRADRPFSVEIMVDGLTYDPDAPEAAQKVKVLRHVQAYQATGNGKLVDRGQAQMLTQGSLTENGTVKLDYDLTAIPGNNRTKVRGEERFSVFSLEDYQSPESQLDSAFIQIWPVADASINGLDDDLIIKGNAPTITVDLNDLYPDSWTYAQVYPGPPALNTDGTVVSGSSILIDSSVPRSETVQIKEWDAAIPTDGVWTLEVITATPFGEDRLAKTSFTVERAIRINGAITSVE